MKDSLNTLKDFIEAAEKSRKYPRNTALALKTALRLFEPELNEEEKTSVDKFQENFESIYAAVFEKNKTKFSTGSLDTYRKRISRLLNDYFAYGRDATKMNAWKPTVRQSTRTSKTISNKSAVQPSLEDTASLSAELGSKVDRIEWSFNDKRKALLVLPLDLTASEAETLKDLIDLKKVK
jgi:hypothetical protein